MGRPELYAIHAHTWKTPADVKVIKIQIILFLCVIKMLVQNIKRIHKAARLTNFETGQKRLSKIGSSFWEVESIITNWFNTKWMLQQCKKSAIEQFLNCLDFFHEIWEKNVCYWITTNGVVKPMMTAEYILIKPGLEREYCKQSGVDQLHREIDSYVYPSGKKYFHFPKSLSRFLCSICKIDADQMKQAAPCQHHAEHQGLTGIGGFSPVGWLKTLPLIKLENLPLRINLQ